MRRNRKNGKEERKATKTENRKGGWVLIFNMQSFRRDSCLNFSLPYMPISRATRSSLSPNSVLCSYLHVLSMSSRDMTIPSMAAPSVPRGHAPHEPGCHKGFTPTHPINEVKLFNFDLVIRQNIKSHGVEERRMFPQLIKICRWRIKTKVPVSKFQDSQGRARPTLHY